MYYEQDKSKEVLSLPMETPLVFWEMETALAKCQKGEQYPSLPFSLVIPSLISVGHITTPHFLATPQRGMTTRL